MTTEEHITDLDQEGKPIEVELIDHNQEVEDFGLRILHIDFPVPTKPLNMIEFMMVREKVSREIIEYMCTHKRPSDPFKAAQVLANKMKQVLTKHYKLVGVL